MEKLNLYQRLTNVMQEVGRVPKNGHNRVQNYKFVMESDVMDVVRDACLKHGVFIVPSLVNSSLSQLKTSKGNDYNLTSVTMAYRAINIDKPEEYFEFQMIGQGADSQDKGSNKAVTGATKYAMLKLFLIGTGDDAEHDGMDEDTRRSYSSPRPTSDESPPFPDSDVYYDDEDPGMNQKLPQRTASQAGGYSYKPPYDRKDEIKKLGARWNAKTKTWDSPKRLPAFDEFLV